MGVDSAGAVTFTNQASSPAAGYAAAGSVSFGDLFRLHGNHGIGQVTALNGGDKKYLTGFTTQEDFLNNGDAGTHAVVGQSINSVVVAPDSLPIIDNGFKYRVSFDENSGDLPDLVCNTDGLRSVYRLANAAYVSRDEPDRVHFVKTTAGSAQPAFEPLEESDLRHPAALTAGDTIYVGEQRCDIVSTDSDPTARLALETSNAENIHTASVVCATALKENSHSTSDAIVTHDPVKSCLLDQPRHVHRLINQSFDSQQIYQRPTVFPFARTQLLVLTFSTTTVKIDSYDGLMVRHLPRFLEFLLWTPVILQSAIAYQCAPTTIIHTKYERLITLI